MKNFTLLLSKTIGVITATTATLQCGMTYSHAQTESAFLWEIESPQNTIYLLGSVHTLRESDYPLPQPIQAAFNDAERLIFEVNLDEMNHPAVQEVIVQRALPDNEHELLQEALDPEVYVLAQEAARDVGLPIEVFNNLEPWFFAMSLTSLRLVQLGFEPMNGVDFHLFNAARESGKPIAALESLDEQLGFFDALSVETQADFVEQTVLELGIIESSFNEMIDSWKSADIGTFEQLILDSFDGFEEVYNLLLVQRNMNWVTTVESLINQSNNDYLVVVGAAHLVGEDSLIDLLEERGHTVRLWEQP